MLKNRAWHVNSAMQEGMQALILKRNVANTRDIERISRWAISENTDATDVPVCTSSLCFGQHLGQRNSRIRKLDNFAGCIETLKSILNPKIYPSRQSNPDTLGSSIYDIPLIGNIFHT